MELRTRALEVLQIADPADKATAARALLAAGRAGQLALDTQVALAEPPTLPGRPALPRLVPADQVPRRSPFTLAGRAALLHAITHIEFNAIKQALHTSVPYCEIFEFVRFTTLKASHQPRERGALT